MRLPIVLLALAACTQPHLPTERPANACEAGAWPQREIAIRLKVGRAERKAIALIPASAGPHDVVVTFHEFRSNPRTQLRYSGWARHTSENNAIVVAPDARYATWNAGTCCGRAVEKHVDDVAFLNALMARLDEVACTSGRVLATGIGNGGMMAQMWACESDIPDAVISAGGSLQWPECRMDRPIPLLHYHGSDDAFIPADAHKIGLAAQEDIPHPVAHAERIWATRNRAEPTEPVQAGALSCRRWEGAAPVHSCTVQGGVDTWPGALDGQLDSPSPLRDATLGGLAWVRAHWDAPTEAPP